MEFPCQHCGRGLSASGDVIGRYVVCVHCERGTVVPEPAPVLLRDVSLADVLAGLRCPRCDYLLQGLVENRCPECGRRFDPIGLIRAGQVSERVKSRWYARGVVVGLIGAFVLLLICSGLARL